MSDIEYWIKKNLPNDSEFSRNFVAFLMQLAYKEGQKQALIDRKERDREDKYGPMHL